MKTVRLHVVILLLCAGVVVTGIVAVAREETRDWRWYQREFLRLSAADVAQQAAAAPQAPETAELQAALQRVQDSDVALRQVWAPDLGQVSRCPTCHLAATEPLLGRDVFPFKKHPVPYLDAEWHSAEHYGCVVCHGGDGRATTADEAHGVESQSINPRRKDEYAQAFCGRCHQVRPGTGSRGEVEGAPALNLGRWLAEDRNCAGCHDLGGASADAASPGPPWLAPMLELASPAPMPQPHRGPAGGLHRGRARGPALGRLGEKTSRDWLVAWLENPARFRPAARMPRTQAAPDECAIMAGALLAGPGGGDALDGTTGNGRAERGEAGLVRRGRQLATGEAACATCHEIPGYKRPGFYPIPGRRLIGPDLANVADKLRPGWVLRLMADAQEAMPGTAMPRFQMPPAHPGAPGRVGASGPAHDVGEASGPAEREAVAAFVMSLGRGAVRRPPAGDWLPREKGTDALLPDSVKRSQSLAGACPLLLWYGCASCHAIPDVGAERIGPSLANIGDRGPAELVWGDAVVPADERHLMGWLLRKLERPGEFPPSDAALAGASSGGAEPAARRLRMPTPRLTPAERRALVTFLLSRSSAPLPEKYVVPDKSPLPRELGAFAAFNEAHRCLTCHTVGGQGGEVGPSLDGVASKVRGPWLRRHLAQPQMIVAASEARMPRFWLSAAEVEQAASFLEQMCVEPRVAKARAAVDSGAAAAPTMVQAGRTIFLSGVKPASPAAAGRPTGGADDLSSGAPCVACHRLTSAAGSPAAPGTGGLAPGLPDLRLGPLGVPGPGEVLPLESRAGQGSPPPAEPALDAGGIAGPDLATVADRLRAEWIYVWLREGRQLVPPARMPSMNLSDEQARAVLAFLLRTTAAAPQANVGAGQSAGKEGGHE